MSDDVLSVIPTDPYWSPGPGAAERAAAAAAVLAGAEAEAVRHDGVAFIDCGADLERIGCPRCAAPIDFDRWSDLVGARFEEGFATLDAAVPCCGAEVSLNDLDYHWPCGFACFEIEILNPERPWFTVGEAARIGALLGHPVRQVRAHI